MLHGLKKIALRSGSVPPRSTHSPNKQPQGSQQSLYHIQVGNYSFFRDLNAIGAGERKGCNYISTGSPAVGKDSYKGAVEPRVTN